MHNSIAAALITALIIALGAPALAKEHRASQGGVSGSSLPGGFHEGEKRGWNGARTPPGWHQGEKTGWGSGHTPPGLRGR
jgi:hypothetical protein